MRFLNIGIPFLVLPALIACSPGPRAPETARLVLESLEEQQQAPEAGEYVVPLDGSIEALFGTVTVKPEGLQLQTNLPEAAIVADFGQDAARFNRVDIEMSVSRGDFCSISWSSDIEPLFGGNWHEMPRAEALTRIHADGLPHTYTIDLLPEDAWAGRIDKIRFKPSDTAILATITKIRFYWDAPDYPNQWQYDGQHVDTLFGSQAPWKLRVPKQGVFETRFGMQSRAWKGSFPGTVRFLITIETDDGGEVLLLDKKLTPGLVEEHRGWLNFRSDLSAYAGKEVTLRLTVDNLDLPLGDYALWGNPTVYSDVARAKDIPVILISCDTLRADHLGSYGYERDTSPRLDAWAAEEAVLFENAITPVTWTLPSHMTMLTGLHEKNHRTSKTSNLPPEIKSLPELLRDEGYLTGGFTGLNAWFHPSRGFRGFDVFDLPLEEEGIRHIYATMNRVETWLAASKRSQVFLLLHNYDIHGRMYNPVSPLPYSTEDDEFKIFSKGVYEQGMFDAKNLGGARASGIMEAFNAGKVSFTEAQHNAIVALYDDCIRMVDESIFEFFRLLKQQGRYDNALIIVTSDHGEEFNDHGNYGHFKVYEELCRVPLFIKFPDEAFAGTRFAPQVETTDLFATVFDVLGISEDGRDGISLLKVLRGEAPAREHTFIRRENQRAVRNNGEKLIWNQAYEDYELYNLEEDPSEKENVYGEQGEEVAGLKSALHGHFEMESEGWCLQFDRHVGAQEFRVLISSESPLIVGWRTPEGESHIYEYEPGQPALNIGSEQASVLLTIRPAVQGAQVHVQIQGDEPCVLFKGDEAPIQSDTHHVILEASGTALPRPELPEDAVYSQCAIWYLLPTLEQDSDEIDDATREQLEGLGYL